MTIGPARVTAAERRNRREKAWASYEGGRPPTLDCARPLAFAAGAAVLMGCLVAAAALAGVGVTGR